MFWTVTGLAPGRGQCKTKNPGSRSFRESFGGDDQNWTGGWGVCRPLPYHLATSPYKGVMNTTPMERPTRLELATSTLARWRSTRWATAAYWETLLGFLDWCLRSESNQWHGDFQSPALPTELQRRTGRWLLYLKFRFCKGVNANFFEKIEKFLLFGVSACKIRTTFFRGFRAGGSTGKERKNIWQVLQPMV